MSPRAARRFAHLWRAGREQKESVRCLGVVIKQRIIALMWKALREQKGFLLMEYVLSLAAGAVLAGLVCTGLGRTALSWQRLQGELALQQASGYMQGLLERHVSYNATAIRIKSTQDVELDTILGNKKLLLYCRSGGLYLQTTTGNGKGTNPLFMADVAVSDWQVTKLSDTSLCISFTLTSSQGLQRHCEQILYCYNGEIIDEAS